MVGLPSVLETARELEDGPAVALVGGRFVAVMLFLPLLLYGIAAISHLVARRVFSGQGSYQKARLALFLALFLSIPLMILNAGAVYFLESQGLGQLSLWVGLVVFGVWVWIWTSFVSIAEGFSRVATFSLFCLIGFCIFGTAQILG